MREVPRPMAKTSLNGVRNWVSLGTFLTYNSKWVQVRITVIPTSPSVFNIIENVCSIDMLRGWQARSVSSG